MIIFVVVYVYILYFSLYLYKIIAIIKKESRILFTAFCILEYYRIINYVYYIDTKIYKFVYMDIIHI